jgi:UDP-N-acetylglucosamine--N-acetylmuramyl-(pentapeptide) pyrophosphoryl-undecaprenol N-acetylglucosamine transferase
LVLTGGGTGGHVYPALAVVEAGRIASPELECRWLGTQSGLERAIVEKAKLPFAAIEAGAVRGRGPLAVLAGVSRNFRGLAQARRIMREFRPDVVLATGGFVCVPVVLAARLAGVPSVVYLPDLRPGWAVQFLSRFASAVAVSFDVVVPFIHAKRVEVTGYPVRAELHEWELVAARQQLALPLDRPVILGIGGSRGARSINLGLATNPEEVLRRADVVHATGAPNVAEVRELVDRLPADLRARYHVYPYLDAELAPAMAGASVVVARAGASTLGELPAAGVPGILVPYPHAGAHQQLNASFLADRGAVLVVDDQTAREGGLPSAIVKLLDAPDRLAAMAESARRLARPDAARRLFELLLDVASARRASTNWRLA